MRMARNTHRPGIRLALSCSVGCEMENGLGSHRGPVRMAIRDKSYAAIFMFAPSLALEMLAMVSPPPTPKLTVYCAGLPRAVERTAVT